MLRVSSRLATFAHAIRARNRRNHQDCEWSQGLAAIDLRNTGAAVQKQACIDEVVTLPQEPDLARLGIVFEELSATTRSIPTLPAIDLRRV